MVMFYSYVSLPEGNGQLIEYNLYILSVIYLWNTDNDRYVVYVTCNINGMVYVTMNRCIYIYYMFHDI